MKSKITLFSSLCLVLIVLLACKEDKKEVELSEENKEVRATPSSGNVMPEPSEEMLKNYQKAKQDFENNPDSVENIVWYGRRTAYLGNYEEAIEIYSAGIQKFPEDPQLYRHRGHRYITIREFDKAIRDLEKATSLIQGQENVIEPDGMPNAQNIPVSTLHGNIWYHLGLAYYLKHDYQKAYDAYLACRETGDNPDNLVSSTHWLYMIQRRLGNETLANEALIPINKDTEVIENESYNLLCKFYKGLIPIDALYSKDSDTPSSLAVKYGLANWYFYSGEKDKAERIFKEIVDGTSRSSFGYIAAESDLKKYFLQTAQ